MLLWMARPLLTGQVPFTGDLLHFHYPLRDFYAGALAAGQPFDWMPSLFGGFYLVGEGQLGGYHPWHWLLYRFIPLDTAFAIELITAYPVLFAGTLLWLRRWCPLSGAAFGAMLFTFCGFNLSHGVHLNMLAIVAHVPWLLWTIHDVVASSDERRQIRAVAVIGVLTGSQWLLGHPQAVWLSILIEASYAVMLLAVAPRQTRRRAFGYLLSGKGLGVAIGAVQILPTWHAIEQSVRAIEDPSFATTFSLPPLHLLQLFNPYLFWGRVLRWNEAPGAGDEFAAYGGAVALVLALWGAASYPALRRRAAATAPDRFGVRAAGFGLVGLWLAIGSHGGLYYLQTWLPLVRQFRAPVRYVLFTQLALAVVAAMAMSRLVQMPAQQGSGSRRTLWAPWGAVMVSILSAIWLVASGRAPVLTSVQGIAAVALGPALLATAAALLTVAVRGVRWALVTLVLLAAGDAALYGLGGVVGWHDYLDRRAVLGLLDTDEVPAHTGRLMHGGFPNLYTLGGYDVLDGYVAIAPARRLDYRSPRALRVAGVQYVHTEFQQVASVPDVEVLARGWFRLLPPLPRARLVTQGLVSEQPAADLESLDVERGALTTHELALTAGAAGIAAIVRDDPGRIRVHTRADGRQLLVVAEAYDAGWTASIDGVPAPVERVNGDFIGCAVPAGDHDVVLEFRPVHLMVGKVISLSGLALALVLVLPLVSGARAGRRRRT